MGGRSKLVVACLVGAGAALLAARPWRARGAPPPRAIVLVTIDTLRADHVGAYGYERPTTPFLDGLARRGIVFENAYSSISHTTPAHTTLFTGLYPAQHRVLRNGESLAQAMVPGGPPPYRTMAEMASAAGYDTAAFAGVEFLRTIARGFHTVVAAGRWDRYKQADAVVGDALRFVAARKPSDRFLLWVHLFDPHAPDRAPADLTQRLAFSSDEDARAFGGAMRAARGIPASFRPAPAELAQAFARYDAEVAFADRELGRLFEAMAGRGLNERALWIVTGDHGEGLGSHGYGGHGLFVYNEQLRVPLIVYENGRNAGRRISDLVRHVDILPTLAERLGIAFAQPGFTPPGRSLIPLLLGPWRPAPEAALFAQRRPPNAEQPEVWEPGDVFSLQEGRWKYVVHTEGKDEFFDLRTDPLELRNRVDEASPDKDRLGRAARQTLAALAREGGRVRPAPFDTRTRDELRALGYLN